MLKIVGSKNGAMIVPDTGWKIVGPK